MAHPIPFIPAALDPRLELQKRLDAAPIEHAEALLAAMDLLQSAHNQGLLELLSGAVSQKNFITAKAAYYAKQPEGITAIRNLLASAKVLGNIDPELLDHLAKVLATATQAHKRETTPPSLFTLLRRAASQDSRRALSYLTLLLTHLGKSLR